MKTTTIVLAFAAMGIAGCSTAVSPEKLASIDLQKTGLVLATVQNSGLPDDDGTVGIEFALEPLDRPDYPWKYTAITDKKSLWLGEVPPGRYRIADWFRSSSSSAKHTALKGYEFEVRPGRITYLGQFRTEFGPTRSTDGTPIQSIVRPVLENHFDEAVADLHRQYPTLANVPVEDVAPTQFALYPSVVRNIGEGVAIRIGDTQERNPPPMAPKWP